MAQKATQKVEENDVVENNTTPGVDVTDLLKIIDSLKKELDDVKKQNMVPQVIVQETRIPTRDDEITIVNTQFGDISYKFSTWSFRMSKYGQKHTISRRQFQELYNNKQHWFERNKLALDSKHMEYAEEIGCPIFDPSKKGVINPKDFPRFAEMTESEIEKYYGELSKDMQKSFASYFMSKCYEKDPDFYTVGKMNVMNRLTGGRLFDNLILACQASISNNR